MENEKYLAKQKKKARRPEVLAPLRTRNLIVLVLLFLFLLLLLLLLPVPMIATSSLLIHHHHHQLLHGISCLVSVLRLPCFSGVCAREEH
jgi:hypothetical protein